MLYPLFFKRLVQFIVDVGVYFLSVQVFHLLNGVLYYRVNINSSLYIFPLIVGAFGIIFWYSFNIKELNPDGTTEKKYLKLAVIMILVMVLTGALTNSLSEFLHYNAHGLHYVVTTVFVPLVKVAAIVGVLLLVKKIINNRKKDNISE